MKALIFMIPMLFLLTGCPGGKGEGAEIGESRWISVDNERVCYSVDSKDRLSRYYLESNENNKFNVILNSPPVPVKLSYPDTCFNIKLKPGYQYGTMYTLNDINYHYEFFIDNNWNVVGSGGN